MKKRFNLIGTRSIYFEGKNNLKWYLNLGMIGANLFVGSKTVVGQHKRSWLSLV
jgi:hypothetical protein